MSPRELSAILNIVAVAVCACGIDAVGTLPPGELQTLPDGGTLPDGQAPDGAACRSITTNTPGSLVSPKVATAPNVDGDLSDWNACFVPLNRNNAYSVRDIGGTGSYPSGEFSVVHDGAKIYVAVRMQRVGELGNDGASLFKNDSAEIYFDADGMLTQTYGADTTQIVVDHAGRRQGYRMTVAVDTPSSRAASKTTGETVTLELEVSPQTFGLSSFAKSLGFDVALNNGDGTSQLTQIVWFQKCRESTGCGCADGNDAPYCDGRQFGSLMLEP
jgi:hypothetical protein